uniref:peptidylglycine monooxygenase n=1 Tax=Onchocerca volvulus TaxID=6282 RepID=A0A8R1TVE6_ONCVO
MVNRISMIEDSFLSKMLFLNCKKFSFLLLPLLSLNIYQITIANEITELRMPGAEPVMNDSYLCTAIEIDSAVEHYIVGYKPFATMQKAHHMLLFGCSLPGSDEVIWDCGDMTSAGPNFQRAPVCIGQPSILYGWGRDAPDFYLPEGVGFKVGGNTGIQYLVLQVHYKKKLGPDYSGISIESTVGLLAKRASTLLMVTGGKLPPKKRETFETACIVDEDIEIHPFAFRAHTHRHGEKVSGWVVRENQYGQDIWELIGERNPLLPQMFESVNKNITIRQGDVVAARCVLNNKENKEFTVGNTANNEMCNYYLMYWVLGDRILRQERQYMLFTWAAGILLEQRSRVEQYPKNMTTINTSKFNSLM